jgi:hypothetical protein
MEYDEAFRRGVPPFLRRPEEAAPDEPMFMSSREPADGPRPEANGHAGAPVGAAAPGAAKKPGALPWLARKQPAGAANPPPEGSQRVGAPANGHAEGEAPEPAPGPACDPLPANGQTAPAAVPRPEAARDGPAFFRAARERIEQAFDSACEVSEEGDVAFQVTLPRSVIRQIRLIAAEQGTTHRAIVLRSLRLAGLTVPKGADVDRRRATARRRGQGAAARV